jgi:hypothetical protein
LVDQIVAEAPAGREIHVIFISELGLPRKNGE